MNMPAYDESYLDSMMQKVRYLFKLAARSGEDAFAVITAYMEGNYRGHMDTGNPLYLNKTPKQILGSIGVRIKGNEQPAERYDEFILEWMADIYTYMQWKYNLSSACIVKNIQPEELYAKYYPLHEASVENGADKLLPLCRGASGKSQ